MPTIPQYDNQVSPRVGVPDNPLIKPSPVYGVVAGIADQASQILQKKDDDDGRIWAAQQLGQLRASYSQRLAQAQASGEDLNGLPDQFLADATGDVARISKQAPSSAAAQHFNLATADFASGVGADAVGAQLQYRVGKRIADTKSVFDLARNQIATDPNLFPKLYAENRHLLDSIELPEGAKRQLEGDLQGFGLSALQSMGERDPSGTLAQIQSGQWDKYLDPDHRGVLVNQLQARSRERDAGLAQDASDLAASNIQSVMQTGVQLPVDQLAVIPQGLTPKQNERYQSQLAKAQEVYRATGDMATIPLGDMASRIESLKPQGGEPDFADKEAAYSAALTRMHQVMNERRQDPGLAVRQAFPDVAQAWQQYGQAQGADQPKALQNALRMSQAAQSALNIPIAQQRLMPDEMARSIAGQIRGAPPEQAGQTLNAVATQFGSYWPKAFRQMSNLLDPASKVAATIDDSATAALLIETSRQKFDELMRTTGAKKTEMLQQIQGDQRWSDFAFSLSKRQGGSQTANDVFQAVQTLALGRMRSFQEDQTTATDKAIDAIIGKKYDFATSVNGQAFRVPKGLDYARIQGAARDALDALAPDNVDVPGLLPGQTPADGLEKYMSAIHRNGYFVTNDDESGVILYNERGVPVTRKGQPVEFKFDQLQATPPRDEFQISPMGGGTGGDEEGATGPAPKSAGAPPAVVRDPEMEGKPNYAPHMVWSPTAKRWFQVDAGKPGFDVEGHPVPHETPATRARREQDDQSALGRQQLEQMGPLSESRDQNSPETWTSRGEGDQGAGQQLQPTTRQALAAVQQSFDNIHHVIEQTRRERLANNDVMSQSKAELSRKLETARTTEDKHNLIDGLVIHAEKGSPKARAEILKQLDEHFQDADVWQKIAIARLHALGLRDSAVGAVVGEKTVKAVESRAPGAS